jgi:hypothetical protein
MKSLSIAGVASVLMLFALSSCATHDAQVATPRRVPMHIFFKEENNQITIERVTVGGGTEVPLQSGTGPTGRSLGELVTYTKNPNCISLNIGGGFYEICF